MRRRRQIGCWISSFAVSAQDRLHLVLGGALLVLLQELVTAAHAPVVGLGQAGAVGPAGAGAQRVPVVLAGSVKTRYQNLLNSLLNGLSTHLWIILQLCQCD